MHAAQRPEFCRCKCDLSFNAAEGVGDIPLGLDIGPRYLKGAEAGSV